LENVWKLKQDWDNRWK